MRKLMILPGTCRALGGTLITLSLLIKGCEEFGVKEEFCVLVHAGSITEKYLQDAGQGNYLKVIHAPNETEFFRRALQWVEQQPHDYPLLLDNCLNRSLLFTLVGAAPKMRWSGPGIAEPKLRSLPYPPTSGSSGRPTTPPTRGVSMSFSLIRIR